LQRIQRICADYGRFPGKIGPILCLAASLSGCEATSDPAAVAAAEPEITYQCGAHGYLTTELYGALETEVRWTAADLECEGMPRPDGDGARLRFAGTIGKQKPIAFIIALPDLQRGDTGKEYISNVTIIEEGAGRFYSTTDSDICWTDIVTLEDDGGSETGVAVSGLLYCVAPLSEVNGDSNISIRDLEFRGLLDWTAS